MFTIKQTIVNKQTKLLICTSKIMIVIKLSEIVVAAANVVVAADVDAISPWRWKPPLNEQTSKLRSYANDTQVNNPCVYAALKAST